MKERTSAQIEEMINKPASHDITKIRVLRDQVTNGLPFNKQVGATCGIYALDAALRIQGIEVPPRKKGYDADWKTHSIPKDTSIRGKARAMGLTSIGEIDGAADLVRLADGLGVGAKAKTERFGSHEELWTLIRDAVNAGKGIVIPYACTGDTGAPDWSAGPVGFAHWCLLFGYAEYSTRDTPGVFMTTYGKYLEVSAYKMFKANQRIPDWPQQKWIKLVLWQKAPNQNWGAFEGSWQAEATVQNDLGERAKLFAAEGWGFGIGTPTQVLHKIIDPPNTTPNLPIASETLRQATLKFADLQKVEYTKTMCGQCVVVGK